MNRRKFLKGAASAALGGAAIRLGIGKAEALERSKREWEARGRPVTTWFLDNEGEIEERVTTYRGLGIGKAEVVDLEAYQAVAEAADGVVHKMQELAGWFVAGQPGDKPWHRWNA